LNCGADIKLAELCRQRQRLAVHRDVSAADAGAVTEERCGVFLSAPLNSSLFQKVPAVVFHSSPQNLPNYRVLLRRVLIAGLLPIFPNLLAHAAPDGRSCLAASRPAPLPSFARNSRIQKNRCRRKDICVRGERRDLPRQRDHWQRLAGWRVSLSSIATP
jgi:hypothetical protein